MTHHTCPHCRLGPDCQICGEFSERGRTGGLWVLIPVALTGLIYGAAIIAAADLIMRMTQ